MTDAAPDLSPPNDRPSRLHECVDTVRTLGAGLALALTLHAVVAQPFTIPSSSMEPGLQVGDYIVVSKHPYGWGLASLSFSPWVGEGRLLARSPARGDVVVFRRPHTPRESWIKRVIGLPGDRVQVRNGQVFVNGLVFAQTPLGPAHEQDDPARTVERLREVQPDGRAYEVYDGGSDQPGDDTGVYQVPEGQFLVMGDNRDNSLDGRWPPETGVGLLPQGNLVGRAEWIVASWEPGASLLKPWTWFSLREGRFLKRIE